MNLKKNELIDKPFYPNKNYYEIVDKFMPPELKREYLKSQKWKKMKKFIHFRDGVCQLCGSDKNLEVHHITYDRLGDENPDDLILLCRTCHQDIHDALGYDRNKRYNLLSYKIEKAVSTLNK
jgi:5-methylcytosine-specific restriction endonuclease McrA